MADNNLNPTLEYKPKQPESQEDVITSIADDVRSKYPLPDRNQQNQDAFSSPIPLPGAQQENPFAVSFKEEMPFEQLYTQTGDGNYSAMFPEYVKGVNNWERMAQSQTTGEKWKNGALKALGNTATTALGGTAGAVIGITEMIKQGSFNAIYDNDFSNSLMNWNEELGYELPNYYTQEEQDLNFLQSMGTANFWANDVLHGLSFTIGTLASEAAWGVATGGLGIGVGSVARSAARVGLGGMKSAAQLAKANSKAARGVKNMVRSGEWSAKQARQAGRLAEGANAIRFTYTSAGTEAGIEALSFKKEAEAEFKRNIEESFGRQPNPEEWAEFRSDLNDTANAVYGTNLALVGSSNLAIFGRMFGVQNPFKSASTSANRSLFGIGSKETTREGRKIFEKLDPTKAQRFAGSAYGVMKAPIIEGIWEEGMQGVTQNSAQTFLQSAYDPNATKENIGITESIYEGIAETYGSKEGWKEIGIGMIIGAFGGAVSGSMGEVSRARKAYEQTLNLQNLYSVDNIAENFKVANGISKAMRDADEASLKNDLLGKDMATKRMMYFNAMANDRAGKQDAVEDFRTAMEGMPNEYWQEIGIDPTTQEGAEQVETTKENLTQQYKDIQEDYKTNKATARYLVGNGGIVGVEDSSELVEAVAYSLTMGNNADTFAKQAFDEVMKEFSYAVDIGENMKGSVKMNEVIGRAHKRTKDRFRYHQDRLMKADEELQKATDNLRDIQTQQTREDNTGAAERLNKAQDRVLKAEQRVQEEEQKVQQLYNMAKAQNPYAQEEDIEDPVTLDTIRNSENYLTQAKDYIETIKDTDPARYDKINKLLKEYQKANYAFTQFNESVQGLTSDRLKIQEFNDFISKQVYKGKEANEFTKEFFANQLNDYRNSFENSKADLQGEQINYSKNTTNSIVNKKVRGEELTEREKEFYDVNKDSIETRVKNRKVAEVILDEGEASLEGDNLEHYNKNKPEIDAIVKERNKGDGVDTQQTQEEKPITLKQRIKNAIDNSSTLMKFVGTTQAEELEAKRPTQEEIERFEELDAMESRSEEEQQNYGALIDKLSQWRLIDGTLDPDGYALSDMLKITNQNTEQPVSDNIKQEITEEETLNVATIDERDGSATTTNVNFLQTYENVKVKVSKDGGEFVFSHLNIESLIEPFGVENVKVKTPKAKKSRALTQQNLEQYRKSQGAVFEITAGNTKFTVTISEHGRIVIPSEQFNEVKEQLGFKLVNPNLTKNTYFDVYEAIEVEGEVEYRPRRSDFRLETISKGDVVIMEPQEIENLSPNDRLQFTVNLESKYNSALEAEYNSAKTQEEKDKVFKKIQNTLEIYTQTEDGKVVGVIKIAGDNINTNNESQANHTALRQIAANKFLEQIETTNRSFNLESTIPVSNILVGTPNLTLEERDGNLSPKNIEITDDALDEVVDFGYMEGGEVNLNSGTSSENTNTRFLSQLPKDQKVPFVVFNHNNRRFAYPVSLKTTTVNAAGQVEDISDSDLSISEKIVRINDILLENGIRPQEYDLVNADVNNVTQRITDIIERLSTLERKPNLENWLEADKSILQQDAVISIDLTDRPFKAPKLMVDFSRIEMSDQLEDKISEQTETEVPNKSEVNKIQKEDC